MEIEKTFWAVDLLILIYDSSIHGNPLKDSGIQRICKELVQHPQIVSLDVSDCELTDQSMEVLCSLLPKTGSRPGDLYHCIIISH